MKKVFIAVGVVVMLGVGALGYVGYGLFSATAPIMEIEESIEVMVKAKTEDSFQKYKDEFNTQYEALENGLKNANNLTKKMTKAINIKGLEKIQLAQTQEEVKEVINSDKDYQEYHEIFGK